ncbi:MAG: hypothetical protein JW785_08080, partial [Acidimicrobiia bacterium]|nr:hypothetical protein [Acidimicrobiia bacterium]
ALFEEIAPPLDLRAITKGEQAASRPRRGWVVAVVAAAVVLLAGGGWLLFLRGGSPPAATMPPAGTSIPADSSTTAAGAAGAPEGFAPERLTPATIDCSGELASSPCAALIDGDSETAWNAPAGGVGAEILVRFDPPVQLVDLAFRNLGNEELFHRNARIESVEVRLDDAPEPVFLQLLDSREPQGFMVPSLQTTYLMIRVTGAYPGERWGDREPFLELALGEIEFSGRVAPGPGDETAGPTATVTTFALAEPILGEWFESSLPCCGRSGLVRDLLWDGEQFLALARHPGDASVWRSEDGLTWAEVAYLGDFTTPEGPGSLDHGEAGYLAGGSVGDQATVWYSSDGTAWTQVTLGSGRVRDVAVTPAGLVAVGTSHRPTAVDWQTGEFTGVGMVWSSADGLTWQAEDLGRLLVYSEFYDVYQLDGRMVAVGSSFATPSPLDRQWLAAASDRWGSWEMLTPASLSAFQFDATALVHRYLAAVDSPDQILWSTADGESWLSTPLGGLAVQPGGVLIPQALAGMGEVLVVAGGEAYVPAGEVYNRSDPVVWLREPDGTWRWAEGAPGLDPPAGVVYMAAASLDRVVLVLEDVDDRLLIWVFRPEH